ncbi:sugar MFS transporter [Sporomusa acidovorans]|uniref:L-fucose-proton symporter n=1 Tax=Sporomusa acidovorans (strain ATCC 49682 / DSM 3132 / Mol) TaxID=1123286 RepID=A0ABZ3IWS3_SPOA4|nr:sugar MFS transporter [Sporomusa acidovorans]OZC23402.1 L-fucose-proton symporter [Sporomusa acidovorans DSM 3132]SDE44458.1 MFS transporter, FHS family, L-fucose permease [Sporomusa acidovorans]
MGDNVSSKNVKIAACLVTVLFFLWGLSYGLIDVMNKNFQNQLGITKATSGLLQAAYFGGYFVIATPAALVAKRFGFKGGIIMGLFLYAVGALLIVPASNAHSFTMFLGAFFVIACGLGSLETNANPYITKLGHDEDAAFRINVAQSFNGVGQFLGPIIGGSLFLSIAKSDDIARNMHNVQLVYVGIAAIVVCMLFLFLITKMPEGAEVSDGENSAEGNGSYSQLFSYKHFKLGALAQFLYIAAQVGAGAFFINYSVEHWQGLADSKAAYFFGIALIAFMVGRIVTTPLMKKFSAGKILGVYSAINVILMLCLNVATGSLSIFLLIASFFFMSISFPTIFALSVVKIPENLVKTASSIIIMSIVGGAIMPFFMGHVADNFGTAAGYLLLLPCFLYVAWYGFKGCNAECGMDVKTEKPNEEIINA